MKDREEQVRNEVKILQKISKGHNNIVTLHDYFETPNSLYLVLDLCTGGELFDVILERGSFFEDNAVDIVYTLLDCVAYLHDQGVVHRDIKPENLLFRSKTSIDEVSDLMVADFGLSKMLDPNDQSFLFNSVVGSPLYMAPEILTRSGHGKPVDLWSIGVMTYLLLCGFHPFNVDDRGGFDKVLRAEYEFYPADIWLDISKEAKHFISNLILLNPEDRMTAREALQHPWTAFASLRLQNPGSPPIRTNSRDLLPTVKKQFSKKKSTLRKNAESDE
ncbi:hypothetical protein HDU82_004858 [Entophlyctis luteolus]|nr:hypothetical protein HDU82_004858 [Entophlyctis luteolus]KAJ3381616.1 hypothetical protein HDU84_004988 [Entophlyctis sp. JEL0112]